MAQVIDPRPARQLGMVAGFDAGLRDCCSARVRPQESSAGLREAVRDSPGLIQTYKKC